MITIESARSAKAKVLDHFKGNDKVGGVGISTDEDKNYVVHVAVGNDFEVSGAPTEVDGVKLQYKVVGDIKMLNEQDLE